MIPVFCATMMTLFEGNQQILNLYAESDKPQNFFTIALTCILTLTVLIAGVVGYVGYFAFGSKTKSVILYNLPNEDPAAITAKICYILTIMGSFVIVINPIFHVIESSNWYKTIVCDKEPVPEEGQENKNSEASEDEASNWTFCRWLNFFLYRTLIVVIIALIASLVPSINILMTFTGSIFGTIVNILLPTLFYNRAYNRSDKNKKLEKPSQGEDEKEALIEKKEKE